jgi:hypothetical protein
LEPVNGNRLSARVIDRIRDAGAGFALSTEGINEKEIDQETEGRREGMVEEEALFYMPAQSIYGLSYL